MNGLFDEAESLHRAGRLEEALAAYRRVLDEDPHNADAHNMLGNALADQQHWREAAESYRRALAIEPQKAAAHYNLGNALSALGLLDEAAACYRQALEIRPQHAASRFNLGNVLYDLARWEEAAVCYRRALEADPEHPDPDAAFNLARALQRSGRVNEAVAFYQQAIRGQPRFQEAYAALGTALLECGRLREALLWHRRAVELEPDAAAAHFYLGRTLLTMLRWDDAEAAFRRVLELDPRSGEAYRALGHVLETRGQREELAALAERWLQTSPDDPQAAHCYAAWTGRNVPDRASDACVRATFDSFAADFDQALERLDYRAPALLHAAVSAACEGRGAGLDILDAGCGTGLCGPLFRPLARRLIGVDLSREMLAKARLRGVYDELAEAELTEYLQRAPRSFDVIVAADTLVYFGDLVPVLTAAASALRAGGCFAFTLEHLDQPSGDYRLLPHGRYGHTETYVRQRLAECGLNVRSVQHAILRQEGGQGVVGLVVLAAREPV
jgi:predicted TPR repeat methyltransferase